MTRRSKRSMRSRLAQLDAMLDDSVGDALTMVTPNGNGSAPHNDWGRGRGRVCQ